MQNVAVAMAYANKFGSWTGEVVDVATKARVSERFATYDEALSFARAKVGEKYGAVKFASVKFKRGHVEYRSFIWQ